MSNYSYYDCGTACSTSDADTNWISTTGTGYVYIALPPPRRILVDVPPTWKESDLLALARLINKETNTGWIMEMAITGRVIITDPNIEHRTMAECVPLLRWRASAEDDAKIVAFFEAHPIC